MRLRHCQPPETRLAAVLDDQDRDTGKLYVQKAAQAADEAWQQNNWRGCRGPGSQTRQCQTFNTPAPLFETKTVMMWTSQHPRRRLSAPQLQAQLARLTDRSRLRRLKSKFLSKGAWQQVTRIEDLCHTQVSHELLYHLDACAGSVLTPHDYITNVQKRLGNRAWTGFGECRWCGSFLDPQLEHGETCSTAEATRGHNACFHAVLETRRPRHHHGAQWAHSHQAG